MKKLFLVSLLMLSVLISSVAQAKKVYNETIDPIAQIDKAVAKAKIAGKYVICQVGGNWCPWCLKLADFIEKDEEIKSVIDANFLYIHVNYPRGNSAALMKKLRNPGRFGYPALVVLNQNGEVIHLQDSSFLEDGNGYDRKKVLRFLTRWTPSDII